MQTPSLHPCTQGHWYKIRLFCCCYYYYLVSFAMFCDPLCQFNTPRTFIHGFQSNTTVLINKSSNVHGVCHLVHHITKTCPCNVYPLGPHFYIEKLGNTGVNLFFLFLLQNIDCGYSVLTCTHNLCSEQK